MDEVALFLAIVAVVGTIAGMIQATVAVLLYFGIKPRATAMVARLSRYMWVTVICMLLTWGAVGFDYYDRYYAQPPSGCFLHLLLDWGTGDSDCRAKLVTEQLLGFSQQYAVVLVCGVENPSVERLKETLISVSNPYRIISGQILMVAPLRSAMVDDFRKNPGGRLWYLPILVPKGLRRRRFVA